MLQVERGIANKGADVEIVGLGGNFKTTLTGIGTLSILHLPELRFLLLSAEMFHKELDRVGLQAVSLRYPVT